MDYLNGENDQICEYLLLITYLNKEKEPEDIICQINGIEIPNQLTEVLHAKNQLNSQEFGTHLSKFGENFI